MTPILQQFIAESRDFLQNISRKLLNLENAPDDVELMSDLFRSVHTLKGNSGLFEFPEMSRVLHAAEDLMSVVRDDRLAYSQDLADRLFDAMDFVSLLLDEIEATGQSAATHAPASVQIADTLRRLIPVAATDGESAPSPAGELDAAAVGPVAGAVTALLESLPAAQIAAWCEESQSGATFFAIHYSPEPDCFFKGEDPFFQARQTPDLVWQAVATIDPADALAALDPYRCTLRFSLISRAPRAALDAHFRYVPEQILITPLTTAEFSPQPRAATTRVAEEILRTQLAILALPNEVDWLKGRLRGVAQTIAAALTSMGRSALIADLGAARDAALAQGAAAPLHSWLAGKLEPASAPEAREIKAVPDSEAKAVRRAEEGNSPKTLKVDQEKIDRLMNLIGEMVVAKNSLPFLAGRAETVFGARELSREIKSQYAVISRIAMEMQDTIMQVRMLPVSFVFQRFPRLVRDISRKLGKEVNLVLEGENTEADKNIIESLADPLIHIVRNSLDHGIELPAVRRAAGKPPEGRLVIRAIQEADRVLIDISDDGKGIDPAVIKRKAYENGVIDEATLDRITDQEAVNLIFAAGLSTAEVVSDLSGRGVGMDVVRAAVNQVNGTVTVESTPGAGTRIRLSLPLSMAVTNVMVIESDKQIYGVPMDAVLETVRVPRANIRSIKNRQTTVLRNRLMPLRSLNELLANSAPQAANEDDELAMLVMQIHGEQIGIMVDDFREVIDIILKPMSGILGSLSTYAGSALLGDGSVLMVLNPKELVTWQ
jgi:two-component system chemotaxis sensor kinase CheA